MKRGCGVFLSLFTLCFLLLLLFPWLNYLTAYYLAPKFLGDIVNGHASDYLGATATIIGAFIALIPIFWLIEQNKKLDEQNRLQREQNNTNMLASALTMISSVKRKADKTEAEKNSNGNERGYDCGEEGAENASFTVLRASIPLLRDVACQDNGKYAWVAVMTLIDIPKPIWEDDCSGLLGNVINAFECIGKYLDRIMSKDRLDIVKLIVDFLDKKRNCKCDRVETAIVELEKLGCFKGRFKPTEQKSC